MEFMYCKVPPKVLFYGVLQGSYTKKKHYKKNSSHFIDEEKVVSEFAIFHQKRAKLSTQFFFCIMLILSLLWKVEILWK